MANEELIEEIVMLDDRCTALRTQLGQKKAKSKRFKSVMQRGAVRVLVGPYLMRALSDFLEVAGTDQSRILGPELARTLDAAAGKVIGRKRWITLFALAAASPALISLWLLMQGWLITKEQKEDAAFTAQIQERSTWLASIYSQNEASIDGRNNTPLYSIRGRREAVLALMRHDLERLEDQETDFFGDIPRVNIDGAVLTGINFTPVRDEAPISITRVSFRGSNLDRSNGEGTEISQVRFQQTFLRGANFRNAIFRDCLFHLADLGQTDFRGARFEGCNFGEAVMRGTNFEGASFSEDCTFDKAIADDAVIWPEGFDPESRGVIQIAAGRDRRTREGGDSDGQ